MTIGRILLKGNGNVFDKGSGFVLAMRPSEPSRIVLTANHVVRDQEADSLQFFLDDGQIVPVERVERDESIDVAVLYLSGNVSGGLAVSQVVEGAFWQVDARPRGNDPRLTGTISAIRRPFKNAQGHETHILQLLVEQEVHEYEGYSGSPVVLQSRGEALGDVVTSETPPVIGILVEQLRWRVSPMAGQRMPLASNVLYAIAIQDVLNRFGLDSISAAPYRPRLLSNEETRALARILLECPSVSDDTSRDQVVNRLPSNIRRTIIRARRPDMDIENIVGACQNFPDGLRSLIKLVRSYDSGTLQMADVDDFLRRTIPEFQKP